MGELIDGIKRLPTWLQIVLGVLFCTFVVLPVTIVVTALVSSFIFQVTTGEAVDTPEVQFDFNHDETERTVTITHTGGESLTEERVFINTDGETIPWGDVKTIEQGDTATVSNVEQGQTIRVIWTDDDNNMQTIAEYTVE